MAYPYNGTLPSNKKDHITETHLDGSGSIFWLEKKKIKKKNQNPDRKYHRHFLHGCYLRDSRKIKSNAQRDRKPMNDCLELSGQWRVGLD